MAFRTWSRLLLTALGVSVLAGAGQLGIAYGFGVVRLDGVFTDSAVNQWPAQLAWVGWFAAVATVAGAVGTERLARRDGVQGGTAVQLSVAGAAALGAIVVAPLCMQPARAAELGGTVDPVWAVGICAILGALIGAGTAIVVLLKPPFGWNIALTAVTVWLLALISAAPSVSSTGPLVTVRLGVLEPSWLDTETAQRLALLLLPLVALLAGAAVGALARRRGHPPLVGGAAGAAGPVLLAFAYLTAGPGSAADRYQLAPYYAALIAVAAGALGSAATTVLRRPIAEAETAALEPTDILQPLPPPPAAPGEPGSAAHPPHFAADRTGGEPSRPGAAREASPTGAAAPAHWDWPVPSGLTPAPVPTRMPRAARTALDHATADAGLTATDHISFAGHPTPDGSAAAEHAFTEAADVERTSGEPVPVEHTSSEPAAVGHASSGPASGERAAAEHAQADQPEPVAGPATPAVPEPDAPPSTADTAGIDEPVAGRDAGRDADDLARNLTVPGLLPSGRRTSAIDVLAASRPAPQPPVEPHEGASALGPAPAPAAASGPGSASGSRSGSGPGPGSASGSGSAASSDSDSPSGSGSENLPVPVPSAQPVGVASPPAPVIAPANPPAAEAPVAGDAETASTDPRPGGRSKRGRRARTGPATATPAEATPVGPAPVEPIPTQATPAQETPTQATADQALPDQAGPDREATTQAPPDQTSANQPTPKQASADQTAPNQASADAPPVAGPARSALPAPRPADGLDQVTGSGTPDLGGKPAGATPDPAADGGRGTRNYFFSDDAPIADGHPTSFEAPVSPRPRFPIFEDVTDGTSNAPPAWPPAPAPSRPATPAPSGPAVPAPSQPGSPYDNTGSTGDVASDPTGSSDRNGTPTEKSPVEPAPHPRHRALPDLGRDARWDAFANARRATPVVPNPPQAGGQHADPDEPVAAGPVEEAEPGGGKSKLRRGLFRRNRAKDGGLDEAGRPAPESEALAAQDEEYVDWVAGLASDADGDRTRTLRTGRHHRE
ncbi:hypothetical protein [Micromonospora narathiwatensis]|uniref:Uncharacterized protein n=1 Tax=Micromonospora narathiwatensis TaxID=299146 RepID=A0A1A9A5G4_9ACTN|nr:hypothetical protein [Micromonospora narathiwatensis]SBT51433.1 hypothetical protein GA0070621_4058 [Micromonospora narathiwatensis]